MLRKHQLLQCSRLVVDGLDLVVKLFHLFLTLRRKLTFLLFQLLLFRFERLLLLRVVFPLLLKL